MPTYAYACTECNHRFEAQQSFSDASLTECPECEGRLRKLFNTVGIVFKGSGFYRNDSRESGKKGAPTSGTSSSGSSSESSSGSSSGSTAESSGSGSSGSGSSGSGSSGSGSSSTPASSAA